MLDQILQNSSDNIDIEVKKDGVRTSATGSVLVTITNPNGVVLHNQSASIELSTGRYYFTLLEADTTVLGQYTALWEFTLSGSGVEHSQTFEVVSAISSAYLLPDEYRNISNLDLSEKSDSQLRNYIKRATLLIESYIGGSLRKQTYVETTRAVVDKKTSGLYVQLKHVPIEEVTNAVVKFQQDENNSTTPLNIDSLRVNSELGSIEYFGFSPLTLSVCSRDFGRGVITPMATVTYSAGYDTIPEEIEYATARLTDQLINLETKEFKSLQSLSASGYSESYRDNKGQLDIGSIGDDEVKELLRGYKQMSSKNIMIV